MDLIDWRDWRAEANGLVWRVALPADMPAFEQLWKAKGKLVANDTLPDLFCFPVMLAIVAENQHGKIIDGAYLEAVCDVTKIGASRQGFKSLLAISGELAAFIASRKMRFATAVFPRRLMDKMGPLLDKAGFAERGEMLSSWVRQILP